MVRVLGAVGRWLARIGLRRVLPLQRVVDSELPPFFVPGVMRVRVE